MADNKVRFRHRILTLAEQFIDYESFIGDENFAKLMQQFRISDPNIWDMFELYLSSNGDMDEVVKTFDCDRSKISVQISALMRLLCLTLTDYSLALACMEVGETHPSSGLYGVVHICVAEDGFDDTNFLDLSDEQIEAMLIKPRVNEQAIEAIKIAKKIFVEEKQRRNK